MWIFHPFQGIHGLYARDTPFAHSRTVAYVGVWEAAVFLEKDFYGKKCHIIRVNNSVFNIFAYICATKINFKSVELCRIFAFNQI